MTPKLVVVGGGISGLSSALCVAEQCQDCDITIVSAEVFPSQEGISSVHGFGVVYQRTIDVMDSQDSTKYIKKTMEYCQKLHPADAELAGVRHRDVFYLFNHRKTKDVHNIKARPHMLNNRPATEREMQEILHMRKSGAVETVFEDSDWGALSGFVSRSFVIDTSKYLPWLKNKLDAMRKRDGSKMVSFVQRRVTRLSKLFDSYDLVINCSGLGARWLANDPLVVPARGQYISVEPLPIDKAYLVGKAVICPRHNDVLLGGSYEVGRSNVDVDPDTTERILRRCETLLPAVKRAKVRYVGVGVRPTRTGGARIELEWSPGIAKSMKYPVIHNYGHGTKGISQHWGCALEVATLAEQVLPKYFKV